MVPVRQISELPIKKMGDLEVTDLGLLLPTLQKEITLVCIMLPPWGVHVQVYHAHTTESVIVLSGSAEGCLGDEVFRLKPFDFFVIPPGVPHKFSALENGVKAMCIFSPGMDPVNPDVIVK